MHDAGASIVCEELAAKRRWLRIAVVTETWPPEVNGVAISAARFVDGLRARGHRIELIRPRQAVGEHASVDHGMDEILVRGIAIPNYPMLRMGMPAKRALLRLWSAQRPDVVHIVTEGPLGWSALQAAAKLKLPVISDFRTNFHAYSAHYGAGWLQRPILAYLRKFHNRTHATLVPTKSLRAELDGLGFRGLRVVARGIDTKLFDPARRDEALRASWGAGARDPVFLHLGRIAPEKNLDLLVASYHEVLRRTPSAKLVLVGDGPERRAMQLRLPGAILAGTRTGEDLAAHLASADALLFPSLTETWGNVTLEAMASGIAVVAFNYAAAAELIVHGESGLVATPGNSAEFVALAADAAANPEFSRRVGAKARAAASARSWKQVVQQLESILFAAADRGIGPALRGQAAAHHPQACAATLSPASPAPRPTRS